MKKSTLVRKNDLVDNPTPRIPICLCLDTSGSMHGQAIEELNRGIKFFYNFILEDDLSRYSAEICIVKFGSTVECIEDFASIERQTNVPDLVAGGMTLMGEAVNLSLELLEQRKQEYRDNGVDYYQPWIVVMTDGHPNGSREELKNAIERTRNLEENKKLTVIPIGVGEEADFEVLSQFSKKTKPLELNGSKFKEFFEWLAANVAMYSQSIPGDDFKMLPVTDWKTL